MGTRRTVTTVLADRLAQYDTLVEVGVGERPAVARALRDRGCTVSVTDVEPPAVSTATELRVVLDDVTAPDEAIYGDADAIYALNCPPELQRPVLDLARSVDAACLFTTLGNDPVLVPTTPEQLAGPPVTLHVART